MKKALLLHGWSSTIEECWFPWLQKELVNKGYEVFCTNMPNTYFPVLSEQLEVIQDFASTLQKGDIIIGHSLGSTLATQIIEKNNLSGINVVLIAPTYPGLGEDIGREKIEEYYDTLGAYYDTPNTFKTLHNSYTLFFSDNDPYINTAHSIEHYNNFAKQLGNSVTPIYFKNMYHFSDNAPEPIKKVPEILEYIAE